MTLKEIKERVLAGEKVSLEETHILYDADLSELFRGANEIREFFCGDRVELCSIVNARSGGCEEDCAYCAQSSHYFTGVVEHPLIPADTALKQAEEAEKSGVKRFSLVTSGRALQGKEFDQILMIYRLLQQNTNLHLCASLGCISYEQAVALREVGVTMYHHNLETGPSFFPRICSTHCFEDRVRTIKVVKQAGLMVCSGGIFGMGETREDRLELAFALRDLGVTSVPLNILVPIKGTPLEFQEPISLEEIFRTMAVYRFILPSAHLRLAAGRLRFGRGIGRAYTLGINAALVGNFLTTVGTNIQEDLAMIEEAGLLPAEIS